VTTRLPAKHETTRPKERSRRFAAHDGSAVLEACCATSRRVLSLAATRGAGGAAERIAGRGSIAERRSARRSSSKVEMGTSLVA
jgi:hypothetical protein